MPISDNEHVEALRLRLLDAARDKEAELAEINDLIRALGAAPKILTASKPTAKPAAEALRKRSSFVNTNVTTLVRSYYEKHEPDSAIHVPTLLQYLLDNGVKGTRKSLSAAVYTILKKEKGKGLLHHVKGVGYFRPKPKEDATERQGVL